MVGGAHLLDAGNHPAPRVGLVRPPCWPCDQSRAPPGPLRTPGQLCSQCYGAHFQVKSLRFKSQKPNLNSGRTPTQLLPRGGHCDRRGEGDRAGGGDQGEGGAGLQRACGGWSALAGATGRV